MLYEPARALRRGLLACALAASASAFAAHKVQTAPVAWVNGEPIARTTLVELLNLRNGQPDAAGRPLPPVTVADRKRALDEIIQLELVAQKARAEGVTTTPAAQDELALQRDQVLGQRLLRLMAQETVVPEAEVRARHAALRTEHDVVVRHVLLADEAAARDVVARLAAGADFAALARARSIDPDTREQGGLLPRARASTFVPAFGAAVLALRPGGHTAAPVRTDVGWHVIRLESRQDLPPPPFEEARGWLAPQMVDERVQAQVTAWRQAADVRELQPIADGPAVAPEGHVATVNGQPITRLRLEQAVRARNGIEDTPGPAAGPQRPLPPIVGRAATLEELVQVEVLAQQARARRLHENPSVQAEMALQANTAANRLFVRHLLSQTRVARDEVAALYRTEVPRHDFRVSQILVPDESAARAVLARLDQGAKFPAVAREVSQDPETKAAGGSLGWRAHDQLRSEVATTVRRLQPGRHAPRAVATEQGWVVVRLDAVRPAARRPPLEEATAWLVPQLMESKVQGRLRQLRADADVRIAE